MGYPTSTCAIALATALLAAPAIAQVVDFGKYPDLKGQWIAPAPRITGASLPARRR